ncbi:hypothetical protein [Cryobacterium lactosi]|nr:hypothetical protein [Cryobacterium lactosi]
MAARRADIEAQERADGQDGDDTEPDALSASIDALRAKYRR